MVYKRKTGSFAGVTVELRDENGNVLQTTVTDSNGDYLFENLPDGIYTVVVTDEDNILNGYEHTDSPNGVSDTTDQTSKDDTGYTVDLDSAGVLDEPVSDETGDFGYQPTITNPISLGSFISTKLQSGQVQIDWVTQTEVANLGFKLYGLIDDEWQVLNQGLILSQGDSVSLQNYQLIVETNAVVFSLSDVDLKGEETLHGPYQLGKSYGVVSERRAIDWDTEKTERHNKRALRKMRRQEQQLKRSQQRQLQRLHQKTNGETSMQMNKKSLSSPWYAKPLAAVLSSLIPVANAAQSTGAPGEDVVNLMTQEAGIHEISFESLQNFGVDLEGVPVVDLALMNQGMPVSIQVQGSSADGAVFGTKGSIRFVASKLDTLYTDTNVYTLRLDQDDAKRISLASPALPSGAAANAYLATAKYAPQSKYSFVSPNQSDPWYAKRLVAVGSAESDTVTVALDNVATGGNTGSTKAKLSVDVWGSTDLPGGNDHHLKVSVNGTPLLDGQFDGLSAKKNEQYPR